MFRERLSLRLRDPVASVFLALSLIANSASGKIDAMQKPDRPRIGLVLSGGGARGLAHIGVLEWFEKNRIPVDMLGGTSMGGLIGGMYACGMSPGEIRAFLKTVNWVSTFGTGIRYQDLSFRRKEDRREYPVELELGLKEGIHAPPGLSTGIEVNLLIDRVTLPYSTVRNFSDLPTPFFAVATDILNAEEVVMENGVLSTALRASMSYPGIFPPVEREGKWLVDGGVFNNIPTDVMRSVGADVVIAVNVGTGLGNEKSIQSIFGVAAQTLAVLMIRNERRNMKLADVLISPDLGNIAITDFSEIDRTADLGVTAAEKYATQLRKYALDEVSWQQYKSARNDRRKTELPAAVSVKVSGDVSEDAREEIVHQLSAHAGQPLQIKKLERDLTRLCGEGRYQSADYGFLIDDRQNHQLDIRVTKKTYAPPTLNFALGIAGSDISDFNFGFGLRYTAYDIGRYGTEWRTDINLGLNSHLQSEFYRPFGRRGLLSRLGLYRQGFFAAPRVFYERGKRSFFAGGERVADFDVNNYGLGADFGYETWSSELRIGGVIERLDAGFSTGTEIIEELKGRVNFGRIQWAYDGANSATIPTSGIRFLSEARYYFNSPRLEERFPSATITAAFYKPVGSKGTLFSAAKLGTTFNNDAAPAQKFSLGGPFNLGALDQGEFVGNHEVLVSAGYYHEILRLPPVVGRNIWAIGWYDLGGAFDHFSQADYFSQASIGMTMDTKVGPFALIVAYGEGGKSNIYFSFGRFF